MKRRAFLQALGLSPIAPHVSKLAEILPAPVAKVTGVTSLSEIIRKTMKARSAEIAESVSTHNALLNRLRGVPDPPDMPKTASFRRTHG